MMRSGRLLGLVGAGVLSLAGQGCHLLTFDVHVAGTAMVQGSTLLSSALTPLGPLGGQLGAFDISQTQDFKNQNINKSQIQSVKLHSLQLTISSPTGETFDFLKEVQFQASTDGQPTVTIAHKNPVPTGVSTFYVDLDDVELVDYVAAPQMSITANVSGQPPPQNTTIDVAADFVVEAKL